MPALTHGAYEQHELTTCRCDLREDENGTRLVSHVASNPLSYSGLRGPLPDLDTDWLNQSNLVSVHGATNPGTPS